jgi:hypothetical protein
MSIQTYLSLLVRLTAHKLVESVKNGMNESICFKDLLTEIMDGAYFKKRGIENYCYVDWFSWILNNWDDELELMIKDLFQELESYDNIDNMHTFWRYSNIAKLYQYLSD